MSVTVPMFSFEIGGWILSQALQRSCYQDTPAILTTHLVRFEMDRIFTG
jgi:fucose 4-O-acetylase-like acetyltransferase